MTTGAVSSPKLPVLLGLLALALVVPFAPAAAVCAVLALVLAVRGQAPRWLVVVLVLVAAGSVIEVVGWALYQHSSSSHGPVLTRVVPAPTTK